MIYFVSGWPRSGTSMMMACLMAGGMDGLVDEAKERAILKNLDQEDWPINPSIGELSADHLLSPSFRKECDGHLVKVMGHGLLRVARSGDRVVFMLRDWSEVDHSHEAVFGKPLEYTRRQFNRIRASIIEGLIRKNVAVNPVWYPAVITDPDLMFQVLRATGWPIDPASAAQIVQPDLYRVRAA